MIKMYELYFKIIDKNTPGYFYLIKLTQALHIYLCTTSITTFFCSNFTLML